MKIDESLGRAFWNYVTLISSEHETRRKILNCKCMNEGQQGTSKHVKGFGVILAL